VRYATHQSLHRARDFTGQRFVETVESVEWEEKRLKLLFWLRGCTSVRRAGTAHPCHVIRQPTHATGGWCILDTSRRCTMTRLSADVDPTILEEAHRLAGVKTKRETIDRALREFIARRRARELASLAGQGLVEMSLEDLLQWRSEGRGSK